MRKPIPFVSLALAAAFVAALSACGGSSSSQRSASGATASEPSTSSSTPSTAGPSASTSGGDPACDLVHYADVSAAVGYQIVRSSGVNSALIGTDICTFQGAADDKVVYLTIYNTPKAQQLPLEIQASSEAVSGLGDSAFWAASAGLFVRTGDRMLSLHDLNMTASRDALAALAAKALPHM